MGTMKAKPLDKMTKPELVKALKAAQKRIAKLEADIARRQQTTYGEPEDAGVVHVTQDELSPREQAALDDAKVIFPWETK